MIPARQRLEAGDRAIFEPDDRLVKDGDFLALDGAAQIGFDRQPVGFARAHRGLEHVDAVAAEPLGVIHRKFRVLEPLFAALHLRIAERKPDRAGEKNLAVVERDRRAQRPAQRFGERDYPGGVPFRQQDQAELIAGKTRQRVLRPDQPSEPPRQRQQDRVASAMPTESLTCLKRSISTTTTVGRIALSALAKPSAASSRSRNSSRFGSPVRLSCTAS